ncbi:MAG: tetratricopeptide repeat protein, partial [Candidatus Saccharimonadales bacterium]
MFASLGSHSFAQNKSSEKLLSEALSAAQAGRRDEAIGLASQAIRADAKNGEACYVRGLLYEGMNQHAEAVADFSAAIKIDPNRADSYDHRGSEELKQGHAGRAIADFDRAIELDPPREAGHWRRGIAYYFAGQYKKGAQQFEGYQTVDDNDVENAVWRFLCMAREQGVAPARKALLKIKHDRRV